MAGYSEMPLQPKLVWTVVWVKLNVKWVEPAGAVYVYVVVDEFTTFTVRGVVPSVSVKVVVLPFTAVVRSFPFASMTAAVDVPGLLMVQPLGV